VGSFFCFLHYQSTKKWWVVTSRESMEAVNGSCLIFIKSTAATPDQITEQWTASDGTHRPIAPKLRVRVCSSVEKHAAEQRVEQEQAQALEQAQQSRPLVFEGLANDRGHLMGAYQLMEGKVVNGRAVWQKQGGTQELFLYCASTSKWLVSSRENMEKGKDAGYMLLNSAALTPDQARPHGRTFLEAAEARFVISHD
jgi:hypothetical protein